MTENELLLKGLALAKSILNRAENELEGKGMPQNARSVFVVALMLRVRELFSASIILIEQKKTASAKVLLRTLLETYVTLRRCCRDEKYHVQFTNAYWSTRIDQLRRLKKHYGTAGFAWSKEKIDKLKEDFAENLKPIRAEEYSEDDFKSSPLYHGVYTYLCSYAHSDPLSLEDQVELKDASYVLLRHKDIAEDSLLCLSIAMHNFTNAFYEISAYAELDIQIFTFIQKDFKAFNAEWAEFKAKK